MSGVDTGIEPKMFSPFSIVNDVYEVLQGGILFKMTKEFQQEETDGIIGHAGERILMGDNGTDKGEINQRSDKPGKTSSDPAIGMNFDVPTLVCVSRKPETLGLGKRTTVFGIDLDRYTVELLDDAADGEWCQVSQTVVPFLGVIHIKGDLLKKYPVR